MTRAAILLATAAATAGCGKETKAPDAPDAGLMIANPYGVPMPRDAGMMLVDPYGVPPVPDQGNMAAPAYGVPPPANPKDKKDGGSK